MKGWEVSTFDEPGNRKKIKKETPKAFSSSDVKPKSILKQQKTSEVNSGTKTFKVGKKKPKLEIQDDPKESFVISGPSISEKNDFHEKPKRFSGKKFKKPSNDKTTINDKTPVDKKEFRKKQKELRLKRREKERSYVLPEKSRKLFEELRCNKCPSERRQQLADELFKILTGKLINSVRSHDLSRMVQWIIKVGSPETKKRVVDELINETVALSKTKYANHIIQCILHECDKKVHKALLDKFLGNISALLRNKFAAPLIEEYYSKYAKNVQKVFMRQELFSDLFRGARNTSYTNLTEVLRQNETLKSAILNSAKTILSKLIDKPFALSTNLVTDVLYDFLQNCEEKDKLDIMEVLKTNMKTLFRTKSGNRLLMLLLWESTPKVKKHLVKELKTSVLDIAKSNGNIFLRAVFDSVDDTVLVRKAILPTILDNAEDLIKDVHGVKVILYLTAHRDTTFFHPTEIANLKKADESLHVKKDVTLKEKELLAPCSDALLDKIKKNPEFWLSTGKIALVTQAILRKGRGDKLQETFNALCAYITQSVKAGNFKAIEDPGIHMVLKKLLKENEFGNGISFSECFIKMSDSEVIKKLLSINRGCFILVFSLESNSEAVISHLKEIFQNKKLIKTLDKQRSPGGEILRKHLSQRNIV